MACAARHLIPFGLQVIVVDRHHQFQRKALKKKTIASLRASSPKELRRQVQWLEWAVATTLLKREETTTWLGSQVTANQDVAVNSESVVCSTSFPTLQHQQAKSLSFMSSPQQRFAFSITICVSINFCWIVTSILESVVSLSKEYSTSTVSHKLKVQVVQTFESLSSNFNKLMLLQNCKPRWWKSVLDRGRFARLELLLVNIAKNFTKQN